MFEVLTNCGKSHRARYFINGFHRTAEKMGFQSELVPGYRGNSEWLVLWGVGGEDQLQAYRKHRANGGRVLLADIGYFGRCKSYRESSFRVSIDDLHPQRWVQLGAEPSRWEAHGIRLKNWHRDDGRVLICGMGPKSRVLYGHKYQQWEKLALSKVRRYHRGHQICFRSKPRYNEKLVGTIPANNGDIDKWLQGSSLVVTHHSNVGLDAAIAGVPCVTRDGIAAAYYGADISAPVHLSYDERIDLLRAAAWWNWFPHEMGQFIGWFAERFEVSP